MTQFGFFVDLSRCIGCNACTISCKQWHDLSPGPAKPMRVYQWETGGYPNVRLHLLPIMCYHCETPLCMEACQNKAIYKEKKYGAVLVDPGKCQGDRNCWKACPYGSPQFENDAPGTKMLKCDMCVDRLDEGLKPICVLSCGMRALEFGPMAEIVSKYGNVSRLSAKPGYSPCRLVCPAEVNAEKYVALISEGKFKEALRTIRDTTPFAGVLGRVCTHPCELDCQRGKVDTPLPIRLLKRYAADEELIYGHEKPSPANKVKTKKVAIIGSGPAGLSCAHDLAVKGYPVTVFEAAPKSGGLLRYGIPEYRLPKKIVEAEVTYIQDLGVEIRTNAPVGSIKELLDQGYEAVFLGTGAWISQKLNVPGEDAPGIIYALDFLKKTISDERIAVGDTVVVVGGGSVAFDAARVARRLGAKEVHVVCLETRELSCKDRMPAEDTEIEDAEAEGIVIHPCLGLKRIVSEGNKRIVLETITCCSVLDPQGKFVPEFLEGPAPTLAADTVIVAVGQRPDASMFAEVQRNPAGKVLADELTLETGAAGVFSGGDAVAGQANVINAISQGKRAAESIDRYLSKVDLRHGRSVPSKIASKGTVKTKSARPSLLGLEQREGFGEIECGFKKDEALEEANRCFRCGSTMPCVVFKPAEPQSQVIPWNPIKALELWQKREPFESERLPDIFGEISDVTETPQEVIGRHELVLKPENSHDLLYYTTDNE